MDQNHVRLITRALRQKRRKLTMNPELSADFSLEELNTALLTTKPGKAAGLDGVYPKYIKNFETRTEEWIVSFLTIF
jgi:hypothetical protein